MFLLFVDFDSLEGLVTYRPHADSADLNKQSNAMHCKATQHREKHPKTQSTIKQSEARQGNAMQRTSTQSKAKQGNAEQRRSRANAKQSKA